MINFNEFFPDNLYHAYIIESNIEDTHIYLSEFLKDRKIISENTGDLLFKKYDSFNIEDSFFIKKWHSQKNVDDNKVCIIDTKFINNEAEKTLLKILEEPKSNTYFFIILPDSSFVVDTIKSRVQIIKIDKELNKEDDIENFIKLNLKDRFDLIQKMTKETKENSSIIRTNTINFLNNLEKNIYLKFKTSRKKEHIVLLEEILKSKKFLNSPGSSPKMILENIAILLD
jgi:hypothetical protein